MGEFDGVHGTLWSRWVDGVNFMLTAIVGAVAGMSGLHLETALGNLEIRCRRSLHDEPWPAACPPTRALFDHGSPARRAPGGELPRSDSHSDPCVLLRRWLCLQTTHRRPLQVLAVRMYLSSRKKLYDPSEDRLQPSSQLGFFWNVLGERFRFPRHTDVLELEVLISHFQRLADCRTAHVPLLMLVDKGSEQESTAHGCPTGATRPTHRLVFYSVSRWRESPAAPCVCLPQRTCFRLPPNVRSNFVLRHFPHLLSPIKSQSSSTRCRQNPRVDCNF